MPCREWNETHEDTHTHTHRFMQFYSSLKPLVMDRQLSPCLQAYLYCSLIHAKADRYWTWGRNRAWSNKFWSIMQGLLWGRDIVNIIQHSLNPLLSCLYSFLNPSRFFNWLLQRSYYSSFSTLLHLLDRNLN